MAQTTKRIRVTELDFTDIKNNLKSYLQSQDAFKDYNFEGSAMNVLLDVLSYNTHYNAVYANMVANEMFLDSAVKRDSIVSLAKHLGYTPNSSTASTARLNITVNNPVGSPATLTMSRGTTFQTRVADVNYQFVALNNVTITPNEGVYTFTNVDVKEGTLVSLQYTKSGDAQRFLIQDEKADVSTLRVRVQNSTTDATTRTFTKVDNVLDVKSDSTVYFLQAAEDGFYEVTFGDGILGVALDDGNIITIDYLVTNEDEANGADSFTLSSSIGGSTNATITTVIAAENGGPRETMSSIKFNAPKYYSSQNRAVTAEDYKVILPKLYNNIDTMQVWGGEDNDPPIYGKVFLSIKPKTGRTLTTSTKENIRTSILSGRTMVSITPEIVDPIYINLAPTVNVYWNPNITTSGSTDISTKVKSTVLNFYNNEIKKFDTVFRYSKFVSEIDKSDVGIVSNMTTIRVHRVIDALVGSQTKYTVNFFNAIFTQGANTPANLSSTGFVPSGRTETHYLDDDGEGNVRAYYLEEGSATKVYTNLQQGTINYATGKVIVDQLNIASTVLDNNQFKIFVTLDSNDIVSVRNALLIIDENDIVVNTIVDKVATGESSAGVDYTTTKSNELSRTGSSSTTTSTTSTGSSSSSSSSSSNGSY
jgi:hypothetical protein